MRTKDNAIKLANALTVGPVLAIGFSVYDKKMDYLMDTTEMHDAVRLLNRVGIPVGRIDSGGSPSWDVKTY